MHNGLRGQLGTNSLFSFRREEEVKRGRILLWVCSYATMFVIIGHIRKFLRRKWTRILLRRTPHNFAIMVPQSLTRLRLSTILCAASRIPVS